MNCTDKYFTCVSDKEGSVFVSDGADTALVCDDVAQPCPSASAAEEDIEDDNLQCVHKEKDFISLLSCTPGQFN